MLPEPATVPRSTPIALLTAVVWFGQSTDIGRTTDRQAAGDDH